MTDILNDMKNGKITVGECEAKMNELNENKKTEKKITYKVSPKGGISFYNIRRMPITLYLKELDDIVNIVKTPEFNMFVEQNKASNKFSMR
jgi:hypothetical protein